MICTLTLVILIAETVYAKKSGSSWKQDTQNDDFLSESITLKSLDKLWWFAPQSL